ncbi:MAG: ABC transporter permease subunit [Gemmatimonadetes bacterium]|jgi:ABC-type transport system involved in multi-copper enzyme maturation permease subunit|nr:ABC transporter permease subunit [Gemmatimonadota bacterium]MBT5965232.1 ABC transporter permease subunit [Gemmatimonadota bacterium]MBT6628144.1 ABC transporter permease subunit [Gemmatimonadota bacterium]MBT7456427.1 ABC transporter permease subunit [Gemmatimonadota bacterium]
MLGTLIRKELLGNLLTLRLGVALLFTVGLAVLTTVIGSIDYSRSVERYESELRDRQTSLEEVTVYRNVQPRILVPPLPLSIFSRGLVQTSGQSVWIDIDYVPLASWPVGSFDNRLMNVLTQIDFTTVVAILLSFLAIVLGFDAICGERERGTLSLVLTNPVARGKIVAAKLIGGIISLWVPFTIAFIICLLIAMANPNWIATGEDWLRLGLLFVLCCLFLAQIFAFSLMVSALAQDASTALIICLFSWLVGGVGYISFLPSVSRFGVDEPAADIWRNQNRELWDHLGDQMAEWGTRHPSPGDAYIKTVDRDGVGRFGHPRGYAWLEKRHAFEMDKRLERADSAYEVQWANWGALAREAYLVDDWSILSPFTNFQVLCYTLANTSLDDTFYLGDLGRDYRDTYISYLRSKGALTGRRWFTDDAPDQEPLIPDPASVTTDMLAPDSPFMLARMAWAEEQLRLAASDDNRRLDLSDMPKFDSKWRRTLGESLVQMTAGLVVLILTTGLALLVAMQRFQRYDPR